MSRLRTRVEPSRVSIADQARAGGRALRARKLRSLLSAFGIAIGVATVVAVLGISRSSQADLLEQLDSLGTNLLEAKAGEGFGMGGDTAMPQSAATQARNIEPVEDVAQVTDLSAVPLRSSLADPYRTNGLSAKAATPDTLATLAGEMAEGRFLDAAVDDFPVVVLGSVAAERLGITSVGSGVSVWMDGRAWQVVGIMEPLPLSPDLDRAALVGYDAAEVYLDDELDPSLLYVRTAPDAVDAVSGVLAAQVNPEAPENVDVSRPSDVIAAKAAAEDAFTSLFLGLGAVALLVGAVGTANVMVMSVLERRGEIGLRRALGATRGHVRVQFLVEAVLLSIGGGVLGVLGGAGVTWGYTDWNGLTFSLPPEAVGYGLLAAVAIGVLAGVYPAARAARMSPTEALRAA